MNTLTYRSTIVVENLKEILKENLNEKTKLLTSNPIDLPLAKIFNKNAEKCGKKALVEIVSSKADIIATAGLYICAVW